jgi:patatin-like phospholipase/acyl hydrolase
MNNETQYVLSLDSGGVRGVSSMAFLWELNHDRIQTDPSFRIHDQFCTFVGSSVGGIIAAVVSIHPDFLNTDYDEVVNDITRNMFTPNTMGFLGTKYKNIGIKNILERYLGNATLNTVKEKGKQLIIPAYNVSDHTPRIFDTESGDIDELQTSLVDVVLATTAYPGLFPPHVIDNENLIDGGLVLNNPVLLSATHNPQRKYLSIGTGTKYATVRGPSCHSWGFLQWLHGGILEYIGDPKVSDILAESILLDRYLRINVKACGIGNVDDTSAENIESLTRMGRSMYWTNKTRIWEFLGWTPCQHDNQS